MHFYRLIVWRILALVIVVGFELPVLADNDPPNQMTNESLLAKWKQDPEHYGRLLQDLKEFHELDFQHQEEIRKLDREFAALKPQVQKRYLKILQKYSYWLDHLPEVERKKIESTADLELRLALVREIVMRQWQDHLPTKTREELQLALSKATNQEDIKKIYERFRKEETDRNRAIQQHVQKMHIPSLPVILLKPSKTDELPLDLKTYLEKQLKPQLTKEEVEALNEAEGKYPQFLQAIHKLGTSRLLILPVKNRKDPPVDYKTLPPEYKNAIPQKKFNAAKLNTIEKQPWPVFAILINQYARKELKAYPSLPTLGAAEPGDFPEGVRIWIETKLITALNPADKRVLESELKKWPEYPQCLHRLAILYQIPLPSDLFLPGPHSMWEASVGKPK